MCGIAGVFDLRGERTPDEAMLRRMAGAMAARGPDGDGVHRAPGLGFAHRRLVVIDRAGGVQPFHTADKNGVLVFNGEIYNHRDLARDLEAAGVSLRTRSDTEVLAEGLNRFGPDFVARLRGMFAFAFWSARDQRLFLVRDRLGEKPLYYGTSADGRFVFASDVNAAMASDLIAGDLDPRAISDYLHLGYVPDPRAIYKGLRKLPPGATLTVHRGFKPRLSRYWRPTFDADDALSFEDAQAQLRERLDAAVRTQSAADVPLGAFLSGGVDSAAIVSSMAAPGEQDGAIATCTIGFSDDAFDERERARAVADRFGARHHEETADLAADGLIDAVARAFGEPFADASALPTFLVCKLARRHVTVALSGDGADEIFAGYRRYPFFLAEERVRRHVPLSVRRATAGALGAVYPKLDWAPRPLRLKTTLQGLGESRARAYLRSAGAALPERVTAIVSGDFETAVGRYDAARPLRAAFAGARGLDALSAAQAVDLATWLPGRMLTKIDRASMAHGLEVRPPFLDVPFVEWAGRVPPSFKLGGDGPVGKRVLKAALEERLGADYLKTPKRGFAPPLADWMRAETGPAARLRDSSAWRDLGAFDTDAVDRMLAAHRSGAVDCSQELWSVVMFDAFLRWSAEAAAQTRAAAKAGRAA
ncbi:MAG: asparagine synthase (glutamine-hydrolyzing) [Pseudomonadota bacterium]